MSHDSHRGIIIYHACMTVQSWLSCIHTPQWFFFAVPKANPFCTLFPCEVTKIRSYYLLDDPVEIRSKHYYSNRIVEQIVFE
jgi:hypothetical protein